MKLTLLIGLLASFEALMLLDRKAGERSEAVEQ